MGNIDSHHSSYLWAHWLSVYFFTTMVCYFTWKEFENVSSSSSTMGDMISSIDGGGRRAVSVSPMS